MDHTGMGGFKKTQRKRFFSLLNGPSEISDIPVYSPVDLKPLNSYTGFIIKVF